MSGEWSKYRATQSVGGSHSVRVHHTPQPMQTGDGRSSTPFFHCQFVSLGRFFLSLGNCPSVTSRWRPPVRCAARLDFAHAQGAVNRLLLPLRGLGAGTGCELQWTLGVPRRQHWMTPLVPWRTCDDWGLVRPQDLFSEGRPLLAVSGFLFGPVDESSHVLWIARGRLQLRGYIGLGQSVAPQCSCAGSSRRQGSHLPQASVGLLHQQRHPTIRKRLARNRSALCNRGSGNCVVGRSRSLGPPCSDDPVSTVV